MYDGVLYTFITWDWCDLFANFLNHRSIGIGILHHCPNASQWKNIQITKFMGPAWGPLGPVGPRWVPWRPHELEFRVWQDCLCVTTTKPRLQVVLSDIELTQERFIAKDWFICRCAKQQMCAIIIVGYVIYINCDSIYISISSVITRTISKISYIYTWMTKYFTDSMQRI